MEPLEPAFTLDALRQRLQKRATRIKPLLLNQEHLVGLGNIYVDEALFQARIHPERSADSLTAPEWRRLHDSIRSTLGRAVEAGGSSIKSYVNGQGEMGMFQHQLMVYGKKDMPCPSCTKPIAKLVVGGRGTHICKSCQPLKKTAAR